jgi:hypothetical protein
MRYQRDDKDHEENEEQNLSDSCCGKSHAAKSQKPRD